MNPLQQESSKPPSYAEYTTPVSREGLLEVEEGLTMNQQRRNRIRPSRGLYEMVVENKVWAHVLAMWFVLFITFIVAVCAMSRANDNASRIDASGDHSGHKEESHSYNHWAERCAQIETALYGDEVFSHQGHHYQIVGGDWGKLTWRDAENDAWGRCYGGKPGYLATIQTPEENEYLRSQMITSQGYMYGDKAWIGGTDMLSEGSFIWVDGYAAYNIFYGPGAKPDAFSNFDIGEPNENGSEDCVSFNKDGAWNDENCYKQLQFFFVEFDA